ncbi:hypothetical protein V493_00802 [Pseudogymnoascus sp. VKM F-4281 (FW-2241)]|nr:hypothetical protein V493_00802 [Pseudogymnoascus sp. VKM F-4281 (FW-2241)]
MDGNRQNAMVRAAEDVIDYSFIDKELPWEAIQAAGSNMAFRYPEGNKRLAMIGDAVVKLVVLEDLRVADSPRDAGDMQNSLSYIGSNANLDRVGRLNNLEAIVNRNPSQPGAVAANTLTATFEALIGAVYLDSGGTTTRARLVMERLGLWPNRE